MFQAARALESAGVERSQAEAIAQAIQRRQNYATTPDVTGLGSTLRTELAEFRADMAALELRLTTRMYAGAVGLAALVAAFGLFT